MVNVFIRESNQNYYFIINFSIDIARRKRYNYHQENKKRCLNFQLLEDFTMTVQTVSIPAPIMNQIDRDAVCIDVDSHRCEIEEGDRNSDIRKNNRKFMMRLMKERGIK